MSFNLQGKKTLITGSSSGIGLSIAKKLESEGCLIGINSEIKNQSIKQPNCSKNPFLG